MNKKTKNGQQEAQEILKKYNHNLFTEKQLFCLKERAKGLTLQEIASKGGFTRQDISIAILAAKKKI